MEEIRRLSVDVFKSRSQIFTSRVQIRWRTLGALIAVVLSAGAAIAHYSPEFPAGLVVNSTSPAWFRFQSTRGLPIDAKLKLSASVDTSAPPSLSLASLQLPETTWTEPSTAVDPASVMRSVNLETTVTTTMTETVCFPLPSSYIVLIQPSLVRLCCRYHRLACRAAW